MKLKENTPAVIIDIHAPRWHDRKVMIAGYKVATHNIIRFTKAKSMQGLFYLSGETIRKYEKETNGKVECYCVPMDELELYEGRHETN